LLVELKEKESNPNLDVDSKMDKENQIIDVEPNATITTTKFKGVPLPFTYMVEGDPSTFQC
jgi:hypothetical protein